ncbi:hypothetical protein HYALB_00007511 [Hymenoscyphus albidus]|uniref:FAD-binding PCMH-type domain-containing protein n=1 Tax=Hymenoscyphus albidus TaxID=595503 RepID=A0A9N9M1J2_9HELO|nr:hypothetical protein HYALB_00007511 [Hymenoscyphus albidus]
MIPLPLLFAVPLVAAQFPSNTCPTVSFSGCEAACNILSETLGSSVHFPANNSDFIVWDAKQQEVVSACRVTPTTSEQVSQILTVLTGHWCRFAVKSGGHARNADDSVSAGGVTIDLVEMKSVELLEDNTKATVGAGHTLGSLYTSLEAHNLMFVGGRVFDVGTGGYLLGGGLSNWAPVYGFGTDNVFEFELVLPNGTLTKVNDVSQPDLYFALRGGMNNFGIVTKFTVRVFPQGQFLYGNVMGPLLDSRDAVTEEAFKLTTEWKNDTKMTFSYGYRYNASMDQFSLYFTETYTDPIMEPGPFRGLNAIPGADRSGLRIDVASSFAADGARGRPPGARNLYATMTYYPSAELDRGIQDIYGEEVRSVRDATGLSPNLIFQPVFEAQIRSCKERGGNALGIEADGPLSIALLTIGWSQQKDDPSIYALAKRWVDRTKALTVAAGKDHPWLYINYASQQQDPFAGYGEKNLDRLRKVHQDVDPMGIFGSRGLCRVYFKLL